jgi:DNA-binding transcriptional regulator YiaG
MLVSQFLRFATEVSGTKASVRPHKSIFTVSIGGMSAKVLADALYSKAGVYLDRKKTASETIKASPYPTGRKHEGYRVRTAKLIADDVKEIRRLRREMTQRHLADRFGVSVRAIKDIHQGKTWKWVS